MADPPDAAADDEAMAAQVAHVEELLRRLEAITGPTAELALETVETLAGVYGAALWRVMTTVADSPATVAALAGDELVGHLLLLHGLHPEPVERRVTRALDEARVLLGGEADVELTEIDAGVARLRVTAGGCGSTAEALASSVADVVLAAAPELTGVEPVTARPPAEAPLIPVASLLHRPAAAR